MSHPLFPTVQVLQHPLIQHKLSKMRSAQTPTNQFRQLLLELSLLMGYEITAQLPTQAVMIESPMGSASGHHIAGKKPVIIPILRAGTTMADALQMLMPSARIGHIGLYRDDQQRPVEYLVRLPDVNDRLCILCDPMIGTGYSAAYAIDILKKKQVPADRILLMALVASPEGLKVLTDLHPDVSIYLAAIDTYLDADGYIIPGLGDAGDRLFGTKN